MGANFRAPDGIPVVRFPGLGHGNFEICGKDCISGALTQRVPGRWRNQKMTTLQSAPSPKIAPRAGSAYLSRARDLFGQRGLVLLAASSITGIAGFAAEGAVVVVIQLMLASLGMTSDIGALPFGIPHLPTPGVLAVLFVVIGVIRVLIQSVMTQTGLAAQEAVTTRLRQLALRNALYHPRGKWPSATELQFQFTEIFPKTGVFAMHAAQQIPLIIQAVGILGMLFVISSRLAAVGLIGIAVIGIQVNQLNKSLKRRSSQLPEAYKTLVRGIDRVCRNWTMVAVFKTRDLEFNSLLGNVNSYARNFLQAKWLTNIAQATPQVCGIVILAIIVYLNSIIGIDGPKFLSFLYLFLRFTTSIGLIVAGIGNLNHVSAPTEMAASFVQTLRDEMPGILSANVTHPHPREGVKPTSKNVFSSQEVPTRPAPPAIKFANIGFSYEGSPNIFENFSLEIGGGQQIGILGRSGTGKSTLLSLALGLQEPADGDVVVGGKRPADYYADQSVRVGYVGPDPFLIQGTILENLTYGLPFPATDDMIREAIAQAAFDRDLGNLKLGLNHPISENGEGLSAGQKQRLSIARALLRKPCILVFDEATSNLDRTTEDEVKTTIHQLKGLATTLVVTHRPELVENLDGVINLDAMRSQANPATGQQFSGHQNRGPAPGPQQTEN